VASNEHSVYYIGLVAGEQVISGTDIMPTHFYRQPLVSAWTSSLHEMVCLCSFVLHITRDVLAFVD